MTVIEPIILGIIQGVGEFLPISSSAHLILIPFLFGWTAKTLTFDVALHFGTLIAVLFVFWKDWLKLFKGVFNKIILKEPSQENKMFWFLVAATIPGALIGFLLEGFIENYFRDMIFVIAILLALAGILIYLGDKWSEKKYEKPCAFEKIKFKHAVIIGSSQALAVFPGFSRSGMTILFGRLLGLSREATAKFSFMLSTPIIFGATILKFDDLINEFNIGMLLAVITAAIFGILSIKFLLNYIKKHDFKIFAYYRMIIAIIVILKLILF